MRRKAFLFAPLLLAACGGQPNGTTQTAGPGGIQLHPVPADEMVPDYAKKPYAPFSRENVVAIALREWRAWGTRINDAPPGPDLPIGARPDREPGLWQRVGDYWWIGQNALSAGSAWTGKFGDFGQAYTGEPAAWSAAFISYVMRVAGAGDRFPYSPLHAAYINAAAQGNPILQAEPPQSYAPQQGELICYGRRGAQDLRYSDLPAPSFYGHCDIVIEADPGVLTVIGGNVSAGVTMKHVPTTSAGLLAGPDGRPVDGRYPWFVVLKVSYDQPAFVPVALGPLPPIAIAAPEPEPEPEPVAARPHAHTRPHPQPHRAKPPVKRRHHNVRRGR